jgi:hypothetical protein
MNASVSTSFAATSANSRTIHREAEGTHGNLGTLKITVVPTPPEVVSSMAAPSVLNQWDTQSLADHNGRADNALTAPLALRDITPRMRGIGMSAHHVARGARMWLRTRGRKASVAELELLRAGLSSEDDDDVIASLLPVSGEFGGADELAERFRRGDKDEIWDWLHELVADQHEQVLPKDRDALFKLLDDGPRHDKSQLFDLFARALGIPRPLKDRQPLLHEVEEQLRTHSATTAGAIEASRFRAAAVAAKQVEPAQFLDTFDELQHSEKPSWVQQMRTLLARYAPERIGEAIVDLIHVMGFEMQALRHSIDQIRLGAVTSELQKCYKSHTLFRSLVQCAEEFGRLALLVVVTPPVDMERVRSRLLPGVLEILGSGGQPMPFQFGQLARDCGLPNGRQPTIAFFTVLRRTLAEMDDEAFPGTDGYVVTLDALQQALDGQIQEEEEAAEAAASWTG